MGLVVEAVAEILLSETGRIHTLVVEGISLERVDELVLELALEGVSTSISDSESLEIDSIIRVVGIELVEDGGEVGDIDSGVRLSSNVEGVLQVLWVQAEEGDEGLEVYLGGGIVVPLGLVRVRESDTGRRFEVQDAGIFIPGIVVVLESSSVGQENERSIFLDSTQQT